MIDPSKCFILIYETGDTIPFRYAPEDFSDANTHLVDETRILTRNLPIVHSKGINSQISFILDLVAQREDKTDVLEIINLLKSRCLANNGIGTEPSPVVIYWGKLFKPNHFYTLTTVTPKYELWDATNEYLPTHAKVQLTMVLQSKIPTVQDFFI
jgi:hypothetical protein